MTNNYVHLLSMIYHSCDVKQQSTNLHIHYIGNHQTFQFMNWNLYIDKLLLSLKFVLQEAIMALLLLAAGLTNILVFTQGNVHRLFNHTHKTISNGLSYLFFKTSTTVVHSVAMLTCYNIQEVIVLHFCTNFELFTLSLILLNFKLQSGICFNVGRLFSLIILISTTN